MSCVSTLPAPLNLTVYQGGTFSTVITWETGDTPAPVNLTGFTAAMTIKTGQTTVISLTTENDRITLGGTAGTITLTIASTDTAALTPGNAVYDLLLTSGTGVVTPLVAGLVTIRESVTAG